MQKPYEEITVAALIPHSEVPDLHLLDDDHLPPILKRESRSHTDEGLFRDLGNLVVGRQLKVGRRIHPDKAPWADVTYLALPVVHEPQPDDAFQWRPLPRTADTDPQQTARP